LHHVTGLPKSTLRRLLTPLLGHHLVRRSLGDQLYRINVALPLISSTDASPRVARIAEIAGPSMVELTRRIKWPCELHLHDRDHMRVIESTRMQSPFHLGSAKMDMEVNLFGAASGRAYLSTLDNGEIRTLIATAGEHPRWGLGRLHISVEDLISDLGEIRARGYASRCQKYDGESRPPDRLHAIGVPIVPGRRAVGALTVIWPHRHLSPEKFASLYLIELRVIADRISSDLARAAPEIDGAPYSGQYAGH
jgi:IclR family mhp operon transcriptional activator